MSERKAFNLKISITLSFTFLLLTGVWTDCNPCMYFHLIPFAIGFGGGAMIIIVLYYLILITLLTLLFYSTIQRVTKWKNARNL